MARSPSTPFRALNRYSARCWGDALAYHLPALHAALEQQRRFRREQLALLDTGGVTQESWDSAQLPDQRDRDSVLALRQVDALLAAGAQRALADIELALARMGTGRYGHCRSCGARIPLAVLKAIPKTTLCLTCQWRGECGDEQMTPPQRSPAGRPAVGR